jgi:LysR family glycine cleavage system transcriptional activator
VRGAWQAWLRAAGVPSLRPRRSVRYDSAQLVLDAAAAGQGVAILVDLLADADLESGRLVRPFEITAPSPWTYYLVTRPEDDAEPHIQAFREWLHAEMAAWQRDAAKASRPRAPGSRKRAKGSFDGRPRRA